MGAVPDLRPGMKKLLLFLFVCFPCWCLGNPQAIIDSGQWFAITKGKTIVFFYDPYQTTRASDATVQSVVYGRHVLDGSTVAPTFLNIHCNNRQLQTFSPTDEGGRQLTQDWHVPRERSVGSEWVKSLCGYHTEAGVRIAFIGLMENPYNPERATHIFWLPEVDIEPTVPGGKTRQVIYYVESDGRGYDGYVYLDCRKRAYATAGFLGLELLEWQTDPPAASVAGYLMHQSCKSGAAE